MWCKKPNIKIFLHGDLEMPASAHSPFCPIWWIFLPVYHQPSKRPSFSILIVTFWGWYEIEVPHCLMSIYQVIIFFNPFILKNRYVLSDYECFQLSNQSYLMVWYTKHVLYVSQSLWNQFIFACSEHFSPSNTKTVWNSESFRVKSSRNNNLILRRTLRVFNVLC